MTPDVSHARTPHTPHGCARRTVGEGMRERVTESLHTSRVYTLTLRDCGKPGSAPVGRRLALVLKVALRSMGFRCIDVREISDKTTEAA